MEVRTTDQPRMSAMEEFEALPEGTRAELIDGEIVMMGSPSDEHQRVALALVYPLYGFLIGKRCVIRTELDVQLDAAKDEILRPDILVVCDERKRGRNRVVGAPDFIAEITSPSTASRDCIYKLNRYLDAGVREYWIVDPERQIVLAFHIGEDGRRYHMTYTRTDRAPVAVLEGCEIDLSLVFPAPAAPSQEE